MKKKILFGLGVVLIAAAMFVNVKVNASNRLTVIDNNLVNMINANEAAGETYNFCYCGYEYKWCSSGKQVLRCGNRSSSKCYAAWQDLC